MLIKLKKVISRLAILWLIAPALVLGALSGNTHSTDLERGSSQYWEITDASQTGLEFTGDDLTWSFWIKPESVPASGEEFFIITKWEGTTATRQYRIGLTNVGGTQQFLITLRNDGLGTSSENTWVAGTDYTALTAGNWYHVVYRKDATVDTLFIDGSDKGDNTALANMDDLSADFIIGAVNNGVNFFDGLIDDVRVWDRALSDAEISSLYSDSCAFSNGASLQGHWLFDNDATDESSNGNDLTNKNTATFSTDSAFECAVAGSPAPTNIIWFD